VSTLPKHFLTPEEYLEIERKAKHKSEYHNGEMFAMSGASRRHSRVGFQLNVLIGEHLRNRPCEGYTSDMRVLVESTGLYTYPDLTVACGEPRFQDDTFDTLLNPTLIAEILSPTTEDFDRGKKSHWYRSVPSLQEYLLLAQDAPEATLYRRQADGMWSVVDFTGMDAAVELVSIGYSLHLCDLYTGILAQDL
jgi:Uma2 family endonuclease